MKKLLTLVIIALALTAAAQHTIRRGLHAREASAPVQVHYDTIVSPGIDYIETKGYDKPLRSARETFFATNTGSRPVRRIALTISYYDTDRHLLHRASHNVAADIPPGESRIVGVRSWDVQKSFYYVNTAVSHRNAKATPFDAVITVDTLFTATAD